MNPTSIKSHSSSFWLGTKPIVTDQRHEWQHLLRSTLQEKEMTNGVPKSGYENVGRMRQRPWKTNGIVFYRTVNRHQGIDWW